jgi:hypothetical protein
LVSTLCKKLWPIIYGAISVLFVIIGYSSLAPAHTANTNADWIFVAITFVATSLFPAISLTISRKRGFENFERPSFSRPPRGPLQSIRLYLVCSVFFAIGSAVALPKTDHKGVMLFWFHAALAAGFIIGERLACWIYAKRIA